MPENNLNPNLLEADVLTLKSREHMECMRSKALEIAYDTCHKLGHFTSPSWVEDRENTIKFETPPEKQRRKKQEFLRNVEEVKDLARINMAFIMEDK